jgi:hypothetical protein
MRHLAKRSYHARWRARKARDSGSNEAVIAGASGSGPQVARAFHRLLALVFLVAWLSLAAQIEVLIGSRGLLPIAEWLDSLSGQSDVGFAELPTWLWWSSTDGAIRFGTWLGAAMAVVALLGIRPRLCFALSVPLYLGYVVAARNFLSFQWDNLLLEAGALAVFLPSDRRVRWIELLFRLLLFKLYFESGIAKYQSHLHDWQDGSAMSYYYETAPLPALLGWFAHHLPLAWHALESRATLAWEILLPFAIFGPRRLRLFAVAGFTLFQILNIATANYGFFCYLALALHVFLLDDADVERVRSFLAARIRLPKLERVADWLERVRTLVNRNFVVIPERAQLATAVLVSSAYITLSAYLGLETFVRPPPNIETLQELADLVGPFRIVNTYHLFGHITRERYEAQFQTFDGTRWTEHDMHYKPGDPARAPPYVAPHQPRVDFLLWFYGLGVRAFSPRAYPPPTPQYVATLLERLCDDPAAVQGLFVGELPRAPVAVRIVFYEYRMTSYAERAESGSWWRRTELTSAGPRYCTR